MSQVDPVLARGNALCERLMNKLGNQYRINEEPGYDFSVSHKPPGKHWTVLGHTTIQQIRYILNTSRDDDVAYHRFESVILQGVDPQATRPITVTNDDLAESIAREVEARVEAMFRKRMQEFEETRLAKEAAKPAPTATAEQQGDTVEIWMERCKLAGLKPPTPSAINPTLVDGRWLRFNRPKWEAHLAKQDQAPQA